MNVFDGYPVDPATLLSDFETRYPHIKEWRGTPAYDFAAECWLTDNGYIDNTEAWEHEAGRR